MISFYEKEKTIGIIGGALYNFDGSPQRSYSTFYTLSKVFSTLFLGERLENPDLEKVKRVDWVTGACMFIKKDL